MRTRVVLAWFVYTALSGVKVSQETISKFLPIPTGVVNLSASVKLADFNLTEEYYRVSSGSETILECYEPNTRVGGVNSTN